MNYEIEKIGRRGFGTVDKAKGGDGEFYARKELNLAAFSQQGPE